MAQPEGKSVIVVSDGNGNELVSIVVTDRGIEVSGHDDTRTRGCEALITMLQRMGIRRTSDSSLIIRSHLMNRYDVTP
jgi:hypothetical protein